MAVVFAPFRRMYSHKREFQQYLDDKRLRDAEIAQFGIADDDYHADGVHRQQLDPFGRRAASRPHF